MNVLVKTLSVLFMSFICSSAFAHTDHALGEGALHLVYHVVFWTIFIAVAVKGVSWYKANKRLRKRK